MPFSSTNASWSSLLPQKRYRDDFEEQEWRHEEKIRPPFGGGIIFRCPCAEELSSTDPGLLRPPSPFMNAILSYEFQKNGKWDFGPVHWKGIVLEAKTSETEWCDKPLQYGYVALDWTMT
ncbi:hypothetical protein B0J14DRAFT_563919 [Halenospora varia]|nr:hypothetical protein B0J14DRAFT_563919 [Halenospora varia]